MTCKIEGHIEVEDYQKVLYEILTSDEYPSHVSTLWDLLDMKFDNIDLEFQQRIIEIRKQIHHYRSDAKIAIVSNDILAEPLVKLYIILAKDLNQTTKTFTSLDDARHWICD